MNLKDKIFYAMIIIIVLLSVYLIWYVHSESLACMSSPLTYGASKIKADNVVCTCLVDSGTILFDSSNISYSKIPQFIK